MDAIRNLANVTTGDRHTMETITSTNDTLSKPIIDINKELVTYIKQLSIRGEALKNKLMLI